MSVLEQAAITTVDDWYRSLDRYQDRLPSKGSTGAALHVLGRLRSSYQLDISHHVAVGEAQISGLSSASLKRVLAEFGEHRPLSAVGGRSNRGARGAVATLLASMRALRLEAQPSDIRNGILRAMQSHIVQTYVPLYFAAKRVKPVFDPAWATARFVASIIDNARESGKAGPVAEYLVGAKLACRFPAKQSEIRNKRFSVADAQGGFAGDFEVGSTAFHVTLAPMPELFEKIRRNLDHGMRVYLLVPRGQLAGAQQNAAMLAGDRIAVEAIESFIATNLDEITEFDGSKLKSGLRCLLEKYNERVDAVELDKSLLIDIPPNLQ